MKPALLAWALAALSAVSLTAAAKGDKAVGNKAVEGQTPAEEAEVQYTTFNGIQVPPMLDIEGPEFSKSVKDGYWFVKFFSPYCSHCRAVAPTWQTLYEFYQTSAPLEGKTTNTKTDINAANSFHGFYNFHFASLNCVAYGDACKDNGINAYPTFLLFKNGEMIDKYEGQRTMQSFSSWVEDKLEQIKPGSRPAQGLKVPEPGATGVDRDDEPDKPLAKDKDKAAGKAAGTKQNDKEAAAKVANAPEAAETAKSGRKKAPKKTSTPNPKGASVPLTAESFQKFVTTSQDSWFIKFYAPWCQHCQHLAPTWAQMGKELRGQLNVGEVNCDIESRLCKDAKVSSYPTIYYFRGGERVEYQGLRGLGDLVSFADKALDSDVKYVDAATFKEMEKTEEVMFVYFFDHATTSEDFTALDRLTLSLIGRAKIVKTDSEILAKRFRISTWPRLLVVRSGRASFYTPIAPKDMRDSRKVLEWMATVWLPLVPELTAANAKELMRGKFTVLGILSRDKPDQFLESKNELKSAAGEWMDKRTLQFQLERQEMRDAKQLRIEEAEDRDDQRALRQAKSRVISILEDDFRKQVRFAWVDGVFWERWLRTTYGVDITNGERVIIADDENRRFWDVTDSGAWIVPSRTSILETLNRITANPPKLASKSTVGIFEGFFYRIRNMGAYHPWFSFMILVGAMGGVLYIVRNGTSIKRGYFRIDEKNGLLGGNNGKAD